MHSTAGWGKPRGLGFGDQVVRPCFLATSGHQIGSMHQGDSRNSQNTAICLRVHRNGRVSGQASQMRTSQRIPCALTVLLTQETGTALGTTHSAMQTISEHQYSQSPKGPTSLTIPQGLPRSHRRRTRFVATPVPKE